ncbi:hypothetical protein OUZ56_018259 [Daphnia magna]|uniref:Uncharacterized protein n=1 Tax=Daphnia magna TaxID=35525 RepID=A0ABQ9Z9I7_9CRUS|nr:hypothetical protein OUZ56_018259 [Daphnia magna]
MAAAMDAGKGPRERIYINFTEIDRSNTALDRLNAKNFFHLEIDDSADENVEENLLQIYEHADVNHETETVK